MNDAKSVPKGRSVGINPGGRFEQAHYSPDEEELLRRAEDGVSTQVTEDHAVSIISHNESPDVPFEVSLNPYRGCEHGCAYCYARPSHEYLGLSAGLDFESRIFVKHDAAHLLEKALGKANWKPRPLFFSGVTDPYQPLERRYQLTRQCLQVLARCRHPVMMITKNAAVLRDLDLLQELARWDAVHVSLSITSLDAGLVRGMEPRSSSPRQRLEAVKQLTDVGVPVGVMAAPIIPGLTDTELPDIVQAAADAGARWVNYIPLRLPGSTAEVFDAWLQREHPGKRERIMQRLRSLREGRLNTAEYGKRFKGSGMWAKELKHLYQLGCLKAGFKERPHTLNTSHFVPPGGKQMELWGV